VSLLALCPILGACPRVAQSQERALLSLLGLILGGQAELRGRRAGVAADQQCLAPDEVRSAEQRALRIRLREALEGVRGVLRPGKLDQGRGTQVSPPLADERAVGLVER